MDEFSPDDHSLFPQEPDETSLNVHYLPGADSNPEVTDPMIQGAWGEVRDELADFILAPEFDDYIKTAFGETVDPELAKEQIKDVLTGENLPEVIMLPAADMEPAVGAYDPLTDSIYLADSLLPDTDGAEYGVLVDVLLEELGHFLDSQLSDSDSPGDEGELLAGLVRGEELTQFQVMMLRGQDDRVDIWVGGVEVEVEASEKVDFEKVDDFLVGDEPRSLVVGDFNRDGIPDLAVANRADDDVSVLSGNGDGSFGSATNFFVGDRPESLAAGDFNGDGIPDLAVANAGSDNVSVLSGKDDGSFARRTNFPVGDEPRSVAVGDFDRNGIPDLAVANRDSNNVSVLLGNGEGSFGSATNFLVGDEPISVAVEDFNGDGIPDLAAANFFSDNVSVLSGKGDGSFGPAINFPVGETPTSVVARDFNADGIPDLAVANRDSNNVSVLSGKGDGSFGSATNFPLGGGPFSVAVEDFNGDGTPDLAVTNFFSDKVSVSLGKGDGSFGSATNFPVGDRPFSLATEDFNGDGILDMAVANWLDGNVSILINKNPITIIPNITISDTKITEGNIDKTAKFTVTLDNPTNAIVKVNYTTASQTAKVNQDYKITTGTLTFRPGETNKNITVPILGDKRDEPKEKFGLKLRSPQNANIKDGEATGTIVDNDPLPQISIGDAKVTEGNRGQKNMEFEVKLNNPSGKTVRVNYGTQEGSAKSGKDFRNQRGVLTFKPGQTEKIVNIPILGDRVDENNEEFQVKLSRARNGKLSDKTAVGRIIDNDDPLPQISIRDAKVTEGNRGKKQMKFEVELNSLSTKTVRVNYATVDGSAKSGKDFQNKRGVVTFQPGQRKKIVNIPILGDRVDENNEQFQVKLSRARNGRLSDNNAIGRIIDNDEGVPKD